MEIINKKCDICSCKISKLTYKKDLGFISLKCPNCNALYRSKDKMSFVMIDAALVDISRWVCALLSIVPIALLDKFINSRIIQVAIWFLTFLIIASIFSFIHDYLELFIFSKFVLFDNSETIEIKKSRLSKLKDFMINLSKNINIFYKKCDICSCKISKLTYKKDLGFISLKCPNCNAFYILKSKINGFSFSNALSVIFGFISAIITIIFATSNKNLANENFVFFIFILFAIFLISIAIFSIIERYLNIFIFSKFFLVEDLSKIKAKSKTIIDYILSKFKFL
ncbi:hypothetical protein [Campylobacter sp. 2018MI13]|uniref:hypothetical protein n=1 Tax=Campylobacter sp. 2018MI13 TaxID=2836737 RepID=UPI001BDA0CD8|nr:hypothetical protein [Campylobacter sp. 2018MI13]MBT0883508.1 hypothetical protein [Campylobacter sp. 2018MI13]